MPSNRKLRGLYCKISYLDLLDYAINEIKILRLEYLSYIIMQYKLYYLVCMEGILYCEARSVLDNIISVILQNIALVNMNATHVWPTQL